MGGGGRGCLSSSLLNFSPSWLFGISKPCSLIDLLNDVGGCLVESPLMKS